MVVRAFVRRWSGIPIDLSWFLLYTVRNMKLVLPLYAHSKEETISAISVGSFEPGNRLPSQNELIERYILATHTG